MSTAPPKKTSVETPPKKTSIEQDPDAKTSVPGAKKSKAEMRQQNKKTTAVAAPAAKTDETSADRVAHQNSDRQKSSDKKATGTGVWSTLNLLNDIRKTQDAQHEGPLVIIRDFARGSVDLPKRN